MKYKGLNFYYDNEIFLRPNIISNFNFIQPGKLYHEDNVQNTYASLGRLRALKYTNINFNEVIKGDSAFLDAKVVMPIVLGITLIGVIGTYIYSWLLFKKGEKEHD